MLESLDNPIWFALTTEHRLLARSHGLARRYPPDVSPLAALLHPTNDGFADLQRLVGPGEHVALFTASSLDVPGYWRVDRSRWIDQMICEPLLSRPPVTPLPLGTADVPEMLELTAATEPGPFLPQTILMGSYFGIRARDGRLVAMAGERLQSTAFAEISAVCTHPEFRGRGYPAAIAYGWRSCYTTFSDIRSPWAWSARFTGRKTCPATNPAAKVHESIATFTQVGI